MKPEEDTLSQFAADIAERIATKTISALQRMTDTLSGADSGLRNAWDEICVQVQQEQSFFWDVYDDTVRSFVFASVQKLKSHEKTALWFQTDPGWDWLHDDEEEREEEPPVVEQDIVQHILDEYVYEKAGRWTNERIRDYLGR